MEWAYDQPSSFWVSFAAFLVVFFTVFASPSAVFLAAFAPLEAVFLVVFSSPSAAALVVFFAVFLGFSSPSAVSLSPSFLAAYHLLKLVGHHMTGYHVASGDKIHLAEFLLKSHAPHKLVDKGVHPAVGIVTAMTA